MSDVLHIGFTGTRFGMSTEQRDTVDLIVSELFGSVVAHHGCCIGADEEFHKIARVRGCAVVAHPGPGWPNGEMIARVSTDQLCAPLPHMKRNLAIVAASHIMIAAPLENEPQPRGGTWATIGMARRALKRGTLQALYVVGRDGQPLDHERWL